MFCPEISWRWLEAELDTIHKRYQDPYVIDEQDKQWGDVDSAALLNELFRPPDVPPLLLICCYRPEGAEANVFLRSLLHTGSSWEHHGSQHELTLLPLSLEDTTRSQASATSHAGKVQAGT